MPFSDTAGVDGVAFTLLMSDVAKIAARPEVQAREQRQIPPVRELLPKHNERQGFNRMNYRVASTVAAILAASAAQAQTPAPSGGLEEIIVTAQRRSESLQDVPLAIQAMTGDTLSELKVSTIDEFVKFLPSVTTANLGPGQSNIYMRGLSVGTLGTQGSGTNGPWPNVAVYLDEQSTQTPGRNLDLYAADLERIEVLTGPQGTLFGAGAQAGVLRYITNKPQSQRDVGEHQGRICEYGGRR